MSESKPPVDAIQKLPITDAIVRAYKAVFENLGSLARAAALPLVLYLLISVAQFWLVGSLVRSQTAGAQDGSLPFGQLGLLYIVNLLALIPYVFFAVAWHRFTLLTPEREIPHLLPAWRFRHTRFIGYVLAIGVVIYVIGAGLAGSVSLFATSGDSTAAHGEGQPAPWLMVLTLLLGIIGLYVVMRVSFVFPAVAVDERYGFRDSWRHTKGQGWRLVTASFLAIAPLMLALLVLGFFLLTVGQTVVTSGGVASAGGTFVVVVLSAALNAIMGFLLMGVVVSLISNAFRLCTGWVPPAKDAEI